MWGLDKELFSIGRTKIRGHFAWILIGVLAIAVFRIAILFEPDVGSGHPFPQSHSIEPLIVCRNADWEKTETGDVTVSYRCREECSSWKECVYDSSIVDHRGRPFKSIAFIIDEMAGEIAWNEPDPKTGVRAVLLNHPGGGGIGGAREFELMKAFGDPLREKGIVTVLVNWQPGPQFVQFEDSTIQGAPGWFTRTDANPSNMLELSVRPASVLVWVRDTLVPPGVKFGTMGCSGGTVATFSPVYWYGLDDIIDYQMFIGGPVGIWDVPAICSAPRYSGPGLCENNPANACSTDTDCGGTDAMCAKPTALKALSPLVDYVSATGHMCLRGIESTSFKGSSYKYTDGNWKVTHPVDFIAEIKTSFVSDTALGVTWSAGNVYNAMVNPEKSWTTIEGMHCGALRDSAHWPLLWEKIMKGFKL